MIGNSALIPSSVTFGRVSFLHSMQIVPLAIPGLLSICDYRQAQSRMSKYFLGDDSSSVQLSLVGVRYGDRCFDLTQQATDISRRLLEER